MAVKLKIPTARSGKGAKKRSLSHDPLVRGALLAFLSISLIVIGFFVFWYVKYDRIIEQRFRGPVFASSAKIFASPQLVKVGSKLTISEIAAELRHAGYSEKEDESLLGSYRLRGGSIVTTGRSRERRGPRNYRSRRTCLPSTGSRMRWAANVCKSAPVSAPATIGQRRISINWPRCSSAR